MKIPSFAALLGIAALHPAVAENLPDSSPIKIEQLQAEESWSETLVFKDPKLPPITLNQYPWPGVYSSSPDGAWLLRIQKTECGSNIAILYRIEPNGRVMEIVGFDDRLWNTSDAQSRLKHSGLYHTGVSEWKWEESHQLTLTLSGSNDQKSGDGITTTIHYNLNANTFTAQSGK